MMATQPRPYRFTVDEFEQLNLTDVLGDEIRVELIDGEIIEMSPTGIRHAQCVSNLTELLVVQLIALNTNKRHQVWSQNPIRLSARTVCCRNPMLRWYAAAVT